MTDFGYWSPYFADNKYPCYVRDLRTEEIIYANQEFFKVFDCDESVVGKKFHEIVELDGVSYDHIKESILQNNDYDFGFHYEKTNEYYRGFAHLVRDNRSVFCQFRILLDDDSILEKALTRCMEIYQQPTETVLISLMELLCGYYHSERAYVYRFNYDTKTINCVSQWCKDPLFRVTEEVGTKMDSSFLFKWIEHENDEGIVCANVEDEGYDPNSVAGQILSTFKMHDMTLCTVEDVNHKIVGVVGLSNRADSAGYFDRRLLNTISRFVAQDVTKGIVDAQMIQLHHRDPLTGLYNRIGYGKRLDKMLENKPETMGVVSININGLKYINENQGIEEGDEHIKKSAIFFKQFFGYEFYRMSGDEFLGLAPNAEKEEFESKMKELHTAMRKEDNYDFSFGHAWGKGKVELTKLIFEAETIMYINKQEYYANSERKFDSVTDNILAELLSYLDNDEFMIYLQPQVHLEDGSLYGAEALIRRFDKTNKKMVFPDQFISLYEQKSVIRHVDMFVVHAVCRLIAEWKDRGKEIPISVNLSRVTLQEYGIVNNIVEICNKYQVPHHLLVIEVTERVGLIENNVASALITAFKDEGFNISLDDFGCAYSNIVTLAQIEVDEVKIDKSLVDDLTTSKKNRVLVKNVLSMCNELEGASTLAEGIEDVEQANLLHELGCHLGQGYYYSRPIPVDEFSEKYMK